MKTNTPLDFLATAVAELLFISKASNSEVEEMLKSHDVTLDQLAEHVKAPEYRQRKEFVVGKQFAKQIIERQIEAINYFLK